MELPDFFLQLVVDDEHSELRVILLALGLG